MRELPVITAQNVTIDYQLALLRERIIAWFIDILIIYFSVIIISLFTLASDPNGALAQIFTYFVIYPIFLFYHAAFEIFNNGQSLGKRAMSIRVVKVNGEIPSVSEYLVRWAFRPFDILVTSGGLAAVMISSSGKGQRLGDLLANTTVIKSKPNLRFSLRDIMKLERKDYTPKYPAAVNLTEKEAVLVKQTLERLKQHANKETRLAAGELYRHVYALVKPTEKPESEYLFLRTVLSDYIILTR